MQIWTIPENEFYGVKGSSCIYKLYFSLILSVVTQNLRNRYIFLVGNKHADMEKKKIEIKVTC